MKNENGIKTVVLMLDEKSKESVATMVGTGEVGRAKAKCTEGDRYVPVIGAVIALCRAMGHNPVSVCKNVLKAYKGSVSVKVREMQKKREDLRGMQVGLVKVGRCKLVAVGSRAQMDKAEGTRGYGVLGTPTKFKTADGEPLFVGDLVVVEMLSGTVRGGRKWVPMSTLEFVVDEDSDNEASKGQYVMGILSSCNAKTGKIGGGVRVRLAKRWKEVEVGDQQGGIAVEWEDVE